MKKLIATDFDGTFFRNGKVDPEDAEGVRLWREAGFKFGFVTGRGTDFFGTVKELGIDADFIILYNGALIADAAGNVIYEDFIDRETYSALEKFFEKSPDVCSFGRAGEALRYHQYYARYETPQRALEVAAEVNRIFGEKVNAVVNYHHINIGAKGTGKAEGVSRILEYYGFLPDEAAAVGDNFNDIAMLKAHNGWAVDSARDEIKRCVSHTCAGVGALALELLHRN